MSSLATPEPLKSPGLRQLFDYWTRLRGTRFAPARAELRPTEMPRALPHILLMDPLADGDFRIRLMGTHIVNGVGADLTGRPLSTLARGTEEDFLSTLGREVRDARAPVLYGTLRSVISAQPVSIAEAVGLPLSQSGERVDMVLAGLSLALRTSIGPLAIGVRR